MSRRSGAASRRDAAAAAARSVRPDALTIGFARRFATYKRANLILADIERLASMVNDPKRPVQFVFAGKAHPHDEPGKRVLQQIAELMRDPRFADKFVFVEDYDINVGRHLGAGRRRVAQQSAAAARSVGHQRPEGGAQRRPEPVRARRLVGGSLRRPERLRDRHGPHALQHGRARYAATAKISTGCCATK